MKKSIEEIWGMNLYDKIWSSTSHNSKYVKIISDSIKKANNILEIGLGTGNVFKRLIDDDKTVYGIEVNKNTISYVKKKVGTKRNFYIKNIDARKLNFKDKFDGVCASNIMNYFNVRDMNTVIKRVYNALKPNGLFIVVGYEKDKRNKWAKLTGDEVRKAIEQGKIHITNKEIEKLSYKFDLSIDDSLRRTIDSLKKNNFIILKKGKFYSNTCYFVVSRKPNLR